MPPKKKAKPKPRVKPKPVVPAPARGSPDVEVVTSGTPPKMVQRVAMFTATKRYRFAEEFFMWSGGLAVLSLMVVEIAHRAGFRFGNTEPDHGFPYGVLIGSIVLVVPKLIGRAFAGKALVAVAGRGVDAGGLTTTEEQRVTEG